jgi:uncharacterized membrane protein YidH (DUF202 family)
VAEIQSIKADRERKIVSQERAPEQYLSNRWQKEPSPFSRELDRFASLVSRGLIAQDRLEEIIQESLTTGTHPGELLRERGIPKHQIQLSLAEYYGCPFVENDEGLAAPEKNMWQLDLERLKRMLWFPLAVRGRRAYVIACDPHNRLLESEIRGALKVDLIEWMVALPSDLIRIIEHVQDVNPNFPPSAGRTPLARLRTYLADLRTAMAGYRTILAKGRTGLAFLRTGMALVGAGLVLFKIFGLGYLTILEALLVIVGMVMAVDGFFWYLPARRERGRPPSYPVTEPTFGTTVLERREPGDAAIYSRTAPIRDADKLRERWNRLTPLMKRRFLANDRTDLAEERTILGYYRTIMARARTGLAFTRTGITFVGFGVALFRRFPSGAWGWTALYAVIILLGVAMGLEGFHWYFSGRQAGHAGLRIVKRRGRERSVWDFMFPPLHKRTSVADLPSTLTIGAHHEPGIWGTTGLALERTLVADRRNLKSRLRTVMARSRTGLAFIRTGTAMFSVGLGLLVYFGTRSVGWAVFDAVLMAIGLAFIADGLYWHIPAERTRRQFPYCYSDMEIVMPDYGKPSISWKTVVFSHDEL